MSTQVTQDEIAGTTLGYAQITSNFTTTATVPTQITGLTTTVTIPAGGRRVKITGFCVGVEMTAASTLALTIWDGTVGTGTQLAQGNTNVTTAALDYPIFVQAIVTPAAGSKTYNLALASGAAGTKQVTAGATYPAFILVELI